MKGRRFVLLIGVFLALAILTSSQTPDIITVDEKNYSLYEPVTINLNYDDFSNTLLEVQDPVRTYNYLNPGSEIRYFPREYGLHKIKFFYDNNLLDEAQFLVPNPTPEIVEEVDTDKEIYDVGETVLIEIDVPDISQYSLELNTGERTYRFFTLRNKEIKFLPSDPGDYTVILTKNNEPVAEADFTVIGEIVEQDEVQEPVFEESVVNESEEIEEPPVITSSSLKIEDRLGGSISYGVIQEKQGQVVSASASSLKVKIHNSPVKKLDIQGYNDGILRLDQVEKEIEIDEKDSINTYAIDPTKLSFDSAQVTVQAKGTELWKCKDWNFEDQQCTGSWAKLRDITPGKNYTFLLTPQDPGFAETNWWNTSYLYRKLINVTNNAAQIVPEGYSVKFNLDTTGIKYQNDGDDVRVVFWNGTNNIEIDRTNESNFNSVNTEIWFKLQQDISASSYDDSYYVYYGNPSATNPPSNKSKVYDFWDDFSDLAKWTIDAENIDAVSVDGSLGQPAPSLRHDPDSSQTKNSYYDTRLITKNYQIDDAIIEYDAYLAGTPRIIHQFGPRVDSLNFNSGYFWRVQTSDSDGGWFYLSAGSWSSFGTQYPAQSAGSWYHVKQNVTDSSFTATVDGGSAYSGTDTSKSTSDYVVSHVHGVNLDGTSYVLVDNLKIRKYIGAQEPTITVEGEEEDTTAPTVQDIKSPGSVQILCNINISANVTDYYGVERVLIELEEPDNSKNNYTTLNSGNIYYNESIFVDQFGTHYFTILAYDIFSNLNNTETGSFNVGEFVAPIVSITEPVNYFNTSDTTPEINFTITDNYYSSINYTVYVDEAPNGQYGVVSNNTPLSINLNALNEGQHNITVQAADNSTNRKNNSIILTVDLTGPVVAISQPTNFTNITDNSYTIIATGNDALTELDSVSFYYRRNDTELWNFLSTDYTEPYRHIWDLSLLGDGSHYQIKAFGTDIVGNSGNNDTTYNITLDRTGPVTTITTPSNFSVLSDFVEINATSSDLLSNVDIVSFYYRGNEVSSWNLICTEGEEPYNCIWDVSLLSDGQFYQIRAFGNDTFGNTGQDDIVYNLTIDETGPSVNLISPINNSGNDGGIVLTYNANDAASGVVNCSLILNGQFQAENTTISQEQNTFTLDNLDLGEYNWSVACTDAQDNTGSSLMNYFYVLNLSTFSGRTTDLTEVDISNILNLVFETPGSGLINLTQNVNLEGIYNLTSFITIQDNYIEVDSVSVPELNKAADLQLFNLDFSEKPVILKDGVLCSDCNIINYNLGNLTFSVTGFTAYSASANSNLTIWDDNDPEGGSLSKDVGELVHFFANYTNYTGSPVSGATCQIFFYDKSGSMQYNSTTELFEYNRTFTIPKTYEWNVSCDGSVQGYEPLNVTDTITITEVQDGFVSWWDSSWQRRRQINITENANKTLTEYQVFFTFDTQSLISQGYMNSDCSDIRFIDEDENEVPFYVDVTPRYKCNTTETLLWVQVNEIPNATTTSIYMYYNNSAAQSKSDKYEVFNYTTSKKVYYAVGENVYNNDLAIVSFKNDTVVTAETGKSRTINRGEVNLDFVNSDVNAGTGFNVTGPIMGGASDASGDGDALNPISWASKEFVIRITRSNMDYYVFSPFCDATVYIYEAASGDSSWGTVDETLNVNKGTVEDTTISWTDDNSLYFNASCPVLVYMQQSGSSANFNAPVYPMTDDLWGINVFYVSNYLTNNKVDTLASDGSNNSATRGATDTWDNNIGSNDGLGAAYHLVSEGVSIGGHQSADSDGNEEAYGQPEFELDTEYFVYDDGQYVAGSVTMNTTQCELFDENGVSQELQNTSQDSSVGYPFPSKLYFGDGADNPGDDYFMAGSRVVCEHPFYMMFEDSDGAGGNGGDEQVIYSVKSARQYIWPEPQTELSSDTEVKPYLSVSIAFNQTNNIDEDRTIDLRVNCSNNIVDSIEARTVYLVLQDNSSGNYEEISTGSGNVYANTSQYYLGTLSPGESEDNYGFRIFVRDPSNYGFRAFCNSTTTDETYYSQIENLTVNDITPPAIFNVDNGTVTASTAVIEWDTNEIANSTLGYGETKSLGMNKSNSDFLTSHSIGLIGLSANTLYYYNVTSCDPSGNCNSTGTYNFTSGANPDSTPPTIVNVNVSEITETTARINWTTSENANSTVKYGKTKSLGSIKERALYVKEHSLGIGSLQPKTLYYFNVSSCDLAENCNETGIFNFTTIDTTPPFVTSLNNPSDGAVLNEIIIDFNFTVTDNVDIQNCTLYHNASSTFQPNITVYNVQNNTNTNISIHLDLGKYTWNVLCYDSSGNYDWFDLNYTLSQDDRQMTLLLNVSPNITLPDQSVSARGYANLSDGTDLADKAVYLYLDGELLLNSTGSGSDGSLTVTTADYQVNNYTFIMQNSSVGESNIIVNDSTGFKIGDEILIIQMQEGNTDCNAGDYEFSFISDIDNNNISLTRTLQKDYCFYNPIITNSYEGENPAEGNHTSSVAQVVKIPHFTDLTIQSGTSISAPYWNGSIGGIVAFRATGTVTMDGYINTTARGFRGGTVFSSSDTQSTGPEDDDDGGQGEGIKGWGIQQDRTQAAGDDGRGYNNANGGGGSYCTDNDGGDPGAGGGYGTTGGDAGTGYSSQGSGPNPEEGGISIGTANLSGMYFGGGGGGGSDSDDLNCEPNLFITPVNSRGTYCQRGGHGGGIVFITANTITNARIKADGHTPDPVWDGGPGGGAGGTVWLRAYSINVSDVSADGGYSVCGIKTNDVGNDCGGPGGEGRVRFDYTYLTGSSTPSPGYTEDFATTFTDDSGNYDYVFTAPSQEGYHEVKANTTFNMIISKEVIKYLLVDFSEPTVDLLYPGHDVSLATPNVNLTYRATDKFDTSLLCNVTLNNFIQNPSPLASLNNTAENYSVTLSSGYYYWNVTCADDIPNVNTSITRNFTLDLEGPDTTITDPVNFTNISKDSYYLAANSVDVYSGVDKVTFEYRRLETDSWNTACSGNSQPYNCSWSLTLLDDGRNYQIRARANDTLGNLGPYYTVYNVTLDRQGPITTITDPVNFTNITSNSYSITATATDISGEVDGVSFYYRKNDTVSWNYLSTDYTEPYRHTWDLSSLDDGEHYEIRVGANDTLGNLGENYTVYNITIDRTGPVTNITDPVDFTNISENSYLLQATSTDALSLMDTVLFYYRQNKTEPWIFTCDDNTLPYSCSWDVSLLEEGDSYQIRARGNDSLGNIGDNDTVTNITLDRSGPVTTITTPVNFTNITTNIYEINATSTDLLSDVDSVFFYYRENDASSWNLICTDQESPYNCTWDLTLLNDGKFYQVRAYANDSLGNGGDYNYVYNITVDREGPVVLITDPVNFTNITDSSYDLAASASDLSGIAEITFEYRRNETESWSLACNDITEPYNCSWSVLSLDEGKNYQIKAYGNDTNGVVGSYYIVYNITVAKPPKITNIQPTAGSKYNLTENITISATVRDVLGLNTLYANVTTPEGDIYTLDLVHTTGDTFEANFSNLTLRGQHTINFFANDTLGMVNATESTYFLRKAPEDKVIDVVNTDEEYVDYEVTVLQNTSGILQLRIVPQDYKIKEIIINEHNEESPYSVVRIENDTNDEEYFITTYLVDLSGMNFTTANITVNASGYHLFKCTDINDSLSCNNPETYEQIRTGLIQGENYTFTLNRTDPAFGETLQGPDNTSDTYLSEQNTNNNFGGASFISVGKANPASSATRGLVQFNLSYIPSGVQINSANLSLWFFEIPSGDDTGLRTHELYKVQQSPVRPWVELESTWEDYNSTDAWTTAGGDYTTLTDTQTFDSSDLDSWVTYNVTSNVQEFADNKSSNFGWTILDSVEGTTETRRYYRSSEHTTLSERPRLEINYEDILPPGIILDYPFNNTLTNLNAHDFFYNVTENIGFGNCSLYLNNQINTTNNTIFNNARNNFSVSGFDDGDYDWQVSCYDSAELSNSSGVFSLRIDTTEPTINLSFPGNTQLVGSKFNFTFSATDNFDLQTNCTLVINNTVNQTDISVNNNTAVDLAREFNQDGVYFWNVTCTDNANNTNTSETRSFTVSIAPPISRAIQALPNYTGLGQQVLIRANATDFNGILSVKANVTKPDGNEVFELYNKTGEITFEGHFNNTWRVATYNFTIITTDGLGNTNESDIFSFSLNSTASIVIQTEQDSYGPNQVVNLSEADVPWWNTSWSYRLPVTINAGSSNRSDYPVEYIINFTKELEDLGGSGSIDNNSIRVIEWDGNSNTEVKSQADNVTDMPLSWEDNAYIELVWIMEGHTDYNEDRTYYVYFDTTDNSKPAPVYDDGEFNWTHNAGNSVINNKYLSLTIDNSGVIEDIRSKDGNEVDVTADWYWNYWRVTNDWDIQDFTSGSFVKRNCGPVKCTVIINGIGGMSDVATANTTYHVYANSREIRTFKGIRMSTTNGMQLGDELNVPGGYTFTATGSHPTYIETDTVDGSGSNERSDRTQGSSNPYDFDTGFWAYRVDGSDPDAFAVARKYVKDSNNNSMPMHVNYWDSGGETAVGWENGWDGGNQFIAGTDYIAANYYYVTTAADSDYNYGLWFYNNTIYDPTITTNNGETLEESISSISNTGDTALSGYFIMTIDSNVTGIWRYNYTVLNDTKTKKLRNFTINEFFELADIWNGPGEGAGWNTGNSESGYYRAKVALTDNDGNVLIDGDDNPINSTYKFYVDITPPIWYFIDVTNTTPNPNTVVNFSANWTDNLGLQSWSFYWKIQGQPAFTLQDSGNFGGKYNWSRASKNIPSGAEGKWIQFYFTATDVQGAVASTNISNITVRDITPPVISDETVISTKIYRNESVNISALVNDNLELDSVWANITKPDGNSFIADMDNVSTEFSALFSDTEIIGEYNVTVYANDTYSNIKASSLLQFEVFGWSNLSYESPIGGSYPVNTLIDLTCKVTDHNTTENVQNYPVRFYAGGIFLGINNTDATGIATRTWNISGVGYTSLNCTIMNQPSLYYDVNYGSVNSSINVLVPNVTLDKVEHENNMSYSLDEYETYDVIDSVNITVNNTGRANASNVRVKLNVLNRLNSIVSWFTEQENSCGRLDEGELCKTEYNNSDNGYNITTLTPVGRHRWNITINWSKGGVPPLNYKRDFLIYHVPNNITARFNESEITPGETTQYVANVTNPWTKNLTGANITINCPSVTGLSCSCYDQPGLICNVGELENRTFTEIMFNVSTTGSTPIGDYGINMTIEYVNPGNEYHRWNEIKTRILQVKPLVAFIIDYPENITRSDLFNLTGYAINIGSVTLNSVELNWTLPTGWTNISGGLEAFTSSLDPNEKFWNNISVNTSKTIELGPQDVVLSTYSPDANFDDDRKTITVFATTNFSEIKVSDNNPYRGDTIRVNARLIWDNSSEVKNETIYFQNMFTNETNSTGWATIYYDIPPWAPLGQNAFQINVSYPGSNVIYTLSSNASINITVRDRINTSTNVIPKVTGYGQSVVIYANATSGIPVDSVRSNVTNPVLFSSTTDMDLVSGTYVSEYNNTWTRGYYNFTVLVNNTGGFENVSEVDFFEIRANASINYTTLKQYYGSNEIVNITGLFVEGWDNSNFGYRTQVNLSEPQNLARTDEHIRINFTIEEGKLPDSNENNTIMYCDDKQVHWDAYALTTSNGWVTELQGLAALNFTANEDKTCYIYYDDTYQGSEIEPEINGANYFCDADTESCFTADVTPANEDNNGYYSSLNLPNIDCAGGGQSEEGFSHELWCYYKGQETGSEDFAIASDDGSNLYIDGTTVISNDACQSTTCSQSTYSTVKGRYYELTANFAENTGDNDLYVLIDPTTCGAGDPSGNMLDTECYPFYGDEWKIIPEVGEEDQFDAVGRLNDVGSTNISGYLVMSVERNASGLWTPVKTIVNDTKTQKKRNVSFDDFLDISSIWNGPGEGPGFNTLTRQTAQYRATVHLTDPQGNILTSDDGSNITGYAYFYIDTTGPEVSLVSPTNNSWLNYQSITFKYYPNDTSLYNCSLWGDWSDIGFHLNETNTSPQNIVNNTFGPKTIREGNHEWAVQCYDSVDNSAFSDTWLLNVDVRSPTIDLDYPADDDNVSSGDINFSFTVNDNFAPYSVCDVFVNDAEVASNISVNDGATAGSIYGITTPGTYNWTVNCTDLAKNSRMVSANDFTVFSGPTYISINITTSNTTMELNWSSALFAESYNIYITNNYTRGFSETPNVTGITDLNWTDYQAFTTERRYYKVGTVKGSTVALSAKTAGKHTIELIPTWNLISTPFNITPWLLYNGTSGRDIFVQPSKSIVSLWRYNSTDQSFDRTDYINKAWDPATGSEQFTELEAGRGYWAEVNKTCNLTFFGIVPVHNMTYGLEDLYNVMGWYSPYDTLLYDESIVEPIDVTPYNSVDVILRYNTPQNKFEVTVYYPGWGWFPSFNNKNFIYLNPMQGYYFDVNQQANWTHDPNKQ